MTTTENKQQFLEDKSTGQWQEILFNTLTELYTEADLQRKLHERRGVQFLVFLWLDMQACYRPGKYQVEPE